MIRERKSIRLQDYDYSSDNLFFVTSCVHDRICCFGEINLTGRDPSIRHTGNVPVGTGRDLSLQHDDNASVGTGRDPSLQNIDLSVQNNNEWTGHDPSLRKITKMKLNEFGIIAEKQWHWLAEQYQYIVLHAFVVMPNHVHGIIEIKRSLIKSSVPIKIKPLSGLMGAYKTTVSKHIHLAGFIEFKWQRSFYEHIIRDEKTFESITEYIINNPMNWERDKLYNL